MEQTKIMVESMVNATVGVSLPELNFKRTWERKGVKKPIEKSILEQAIYDEGFEYMINEGILYIHDLDIKKELGIEPDDATEPVNVIILTDAQMDELWQTASVAEFRKKVSELKFEQIKTLANFAIAHDYSNYQKCEIIKKAIQIDIINSIRNKKAMEESSNMEG